VFHLDHFRTTNFDDLTDESNGYHRFTFRVKEIVNNSRFIQLAVGKVRRFLLVHFHKKYVQHQLGQRKGSCRQCGTCCNLLFTCPMLTRPGQCFAYGLCRPQACKVFPIDGRDIAEASIGGVQCGFHFPTEHPREFFQAGSSNDKESLF
jgi:hypothetical protein